MYCGSRVGSRPEYVEEARALARLFCELDIELVNGGGSVGLMGVMADEMLRHGGQVVGVIPRFLVDREVGHEGLSRLEIVEDMHERKARMIELSDALVAIPGGLGTLDEFFEALTWRQLRLHQNPCGVLNTAGYFDALLEHVDRTVAAGFADAPVWGDVLVESTAERLMNRLAAP